MDKDRIVGSAKQVKGAVKQVPPRRICLSSRLTSP